MRDKIYLIFNKYGVKGIRKTLPQLRAGEYATKLEINVDNKYFDRIIPTATLDLDDKFLIEPKLELEAIPTITEATNEAQAN